MTTVTPIAEVIGDFRLAPAHGRWDGTRRRPAARSEQRGDGDKLDREVPGGHPLGGHDAEGVAVDAGGGSDAKPHAGGLARVDRQGHRLGHQADRQLTLQRPGALGPLQGSGPAPGTSSPGNGRRSGNLGLPTSRSRLVLPVLIAATSRVTVTSASRTAGSRTMSPPTIGTVPFTPARPNRCRVRKVTDENAGSSRYRPAAGTPICSVSGAFWP
jgi:hypothetical protein